jgi:site-specific DNA-methyltransferase (adenine-specific)
MINNGYRGKVRTVFADPPYGLSYAPWDQPSGVQAAEEFFTRWLSLCRQLLHRDGTIWVCGQMISLHIAALVLANLEMPVVSEVTVVKPNPRPHLIDRRFVWASETLLWAAAGPNANYRFDYSRACRYSGQRYASSIWRSGPARPAERICGHHPTQKPLAVVERCLTVCTRRGELVLDPFMGSGTSGVVAVRQGYRFVGVDREAEYVRLARRRIKAEQCTKRSSHGHHSVEVEA